VLEAFHTVGSHVYLVRYRPGQEDLARESIYRFVRNQDLAFSLNDASVMGEQIPYQPEPHCDYCDFHPYDQPRLLKDGPPTIAEYLAAVVWMGLVAAPLVGLVILGRWIVGR
jgi:hypothetical protein